MKKQKPYHIYPAHIPLELWAKIEKALKRTPQLSDRRNSHNRIICKALDFYFNTAGQFPENFKKKQTKNQ